METEGYRFRLDKWMFPNADVIATWNGWAYRTHAGENNLGTKTYLTNERSNWKGCEYTRSFRWWGESVNVNSKTEVFGNTFEWTGTPLLSWVNQGHSPLKGHCLLQIWQQLSVSEYNVWTAQQICFEFLHVLFQYTPNRNSVVLKKWKKGKSQIGIN